MINFPFDQWLRIDIYRDFYDNPHLIVASDCDGRRWLLDNPFDDERDDYSELMSVNPVDDKASHGELFANAISSKQAPAMVVRMSQVIFDSSKRKLVMIAQSNGLNGQ